MPWELPTVLDGDLVKEGWRDLQLIKRLNQSTTNVSNSQLKVTSLLSSWYLRNQLLRDSDSMSMAHSLELRTPLVDTELFKTVIGLIGEGHAVSKLNMSKTPSAPLSSSFTNREKTGFAIPVREWLMADNNNPSAAFDRGLRPFARFVMKQSLKANY